MGAYRAVEMKNKLNTPGPRHRQEQRRFSLQFNTIPSRLHAPNPILSTAKPAANSTCDSCTACDDTSTAIDSVSDGWVTCFTPLTESGLRGVWSSRGRVQRLTSEADRFAPHRTSPADPRHVSNENLTPARFSTSFLGDRWFQSVNFMFLVPIRRYRYDATRLAELRSLASQVPQS